MTAENFFFAFSLAFLGVSFNFSINKTGTISHAICQKKKKLLALLHAKKTYNLVCLDFFSLRIGTSCASLLRTVDQVALRVPVTCWECHFK
jgi:hypothetical protein